jgi:hypothetical protein
MDKADRFDTSIEMGKSTGLLWNRLILIFDLIRWEELFVAV